MPGLASIVHQQGAVPEAERRLGGSGDRQQEGSRVATQGHEGAP